MLSEKQALKLSAGIALLSCGYYLITNRYDEPFTMPYHEVDNGYTKSVTTLNFIGLLLGYVAYLFDDTPAENEQHIHSRAAYGG